MTKVDLIDCLRRLVLRVLGPATRSSNEAFVCCASYQEWRGIATPVTSAARAATRSGRCASPPDFGEDHKLPGRGHRLTAVQLLRQPSETGEDRNGTKAEDLGDALYASLASPAGLARIATTCAAGPSGSHRRCCWPTVRIATSRAVSPTAHAGTRRRFVTSEDRNTRSGSTRVPPATRLRRPFGAGEDRN